MKILHSADIHLGLPGYGKIHPETGLDYRAHDMERLVGWLADTAIAEQVDFWVVAGDMFNNPGVRGEQIGRDAKILFEAFRMASANGVQILALQGTRSHDGALPDMVRAAGISNVIVGTAPATHLLADRAGNPVKFSFLPALSKGDVLTDEEFAGLAPDKVNELISEKLVAVLNMLKANCGGPFPSFLLAHYTVDVSTTSTGQSFMSGEDLILRLQDLTNGPWTGVLLGHIHKPQILSHEPFVGYSGSLTAGNFGEINDTKGVFLHSYEAARLETSFLPAPDRPRIQIEVDLTHHESGNIVDVVCEELLLSGRMAELRDALVKISYKATPEQHAKVNRSKLDEWLQRQGALKLVFLEPDVETVQSVRAEGAHERLRPEEGLKLWAEQQKLTPEFTAKLLKTQSDLVREVCPQYADSTD